jgi:hypothetical protein
MLWDGSTKLFQSKKMENIHVISKNFLQGNWAASLLVIGVNQGNSSGMGENVKAVGLELWVMEKE